MLDALSELADFASGTKSNEEENGAGADQYHHGENQ